MNIYGIYIKNLVIVFSGLKFLYMILSISIRNTYTTLLFLDAKLSFKSLR